MIYRPNRVFEHNSEAPALIVNAKGHVAGKLATHVAKNIVEGQKVIVINTEDIVLTGPIERSIGKFKSYLNKRRLTKPEKGQKHHRLPSMFFQRIVRRMVPKKKIKGQRALTLLKVHESCPDEFINSKWMTCPKALLENTSNPIRKFFYLKDLLVKFGWKYANEAAEQTQKVSCLRSESKEKEKNEKLKEQKIKQSDKFKRRVEELMAKIE